MGLHRKSQGGELALKMVDTHTHTRMYTSTYIHTYSQVWGSVLLVKSHTITISITIIITIIITITVVLQVVGLGAACEAAHRDRETLHAHFRDMRDLLQAQCYIIVTLLLHYC
jgi:hypothetical protein